MKKVEKTEEKHEKGISKLAVGVEGGAEFENCDIYEISTELKCLVCKITLDREAIKNICEGVVKAETSFVKSGLVAWELEIKPCGHVKNLVQNHGVLQQDGSYL